MSTNESAPTKTPETTTSPETHMHSPLKPVLWMLLALALLITFGVLSD